MHILHLIKSLKDRWYRPLARVEGMMPALLEFRRKIIMSGKQLDLDAIVCYFDVVSKWHDNLDETVRPAMKDLKEVDYGQYTALIGLLQKLANAIVISGRCQHGWNRTKKGQVVLPENVFLGNIYGLLTHPVPYWQGQRHDTNRNSWQSGIYAATCVDTTPYEVVCKQARRFQTEKGSVICDRITDIENLLNLK